MKAVICDGCGRVETNKDYHNQMRVVLLVKESTFIYDREKDLCSNCRFILAEAISNTFSQIAAVRALKEGE